ncbi:hypothetical protein [Streptomyces pacificus]|uniref:Uncharacterized protein n=1 Tax=Streptomyces pacificus TaxID=2705029 RepID=A0A6A0AZJ0_9ACTN|nr:hypothetical protein [Streptomyces pacificus]GFH37853.1 hypothetical protein SCWH03_40930 [Streptomyces pacificus]
MPKDTARRPRSATAVFALGICLALLVGLGAWLLLGRESAPPCSDLTVNARVQKSVGEAVRPGMSCQALGEAIVKASVGDDQGNHTLAQAQALKDVLTTLGAQGTGGGAVDPALRRPLAVALTDYAPDLHAMLGGITIEDFVTKAAPEAPPWESDGTHHLTVLTDTLRNVVRGIAEDPDAYAMLRLAETRTTGQRLTAVPTDAKEYSLSVPPTEGARALGVLDGIADSVTRDLDEKQAQEWRAAVVDGVDDGRTSTERGLAATWLDGLHGFPEEQRYERLRTQGVDMTRLWTEHRNMDGPTRQGLLAEVERSALTAYREVKV